MLKKEELDAIKSYGALCELESKINQTTWEIEPLKINGTPLEYNDFGKKYDTFPESAEPYGCGNMQFIPFVEVRKKTLKKYNITESEYRQIQEKLDCLSFGCCGWCV